MKNGIKGGNGRWNRSGLAFLKGFLRHPELVGSIVPSSRYLEKRIVSAALVEKARLVVELGPGTGGTTRAILDALPHDARLLAIEIDPQFVSLLKSVDDPRLIVHHGSAEKLQEVLRYYDVSCPDAVVSGIPFSTMPPGRGGRILEAIWASLAPGGYFVAYQFRKRVADLGKKAFGIPETEMELFNVPPMHLFRWKKSFPSKRACGE
ncbi:MAG: methyltransferase domain-containing protein [Deltaproteobacteria bacterium]|nr:methyltransferase domain-containing protein [Deltaproteobacteria bacterium]